MPPARRSMRRTARRTSRRTARRMDRRQELVYGQSEPAPQEAAPPPQQAAPPPPSESDKMEQLKQLGELHAQGILTDEEFAAEKAKILG